MENMIGKIVNIKRNSNKPNIYEKYVMDQWVNDDIVSFIIGDILKSPNGISVVGDPRLISLDYGDKIEEV